MSCGDQRRLDKYFRCAGFQTAEYFSFIMEVNKASNNERRPHKFSNNVKLEQSWKLATAAVKDLLKN